MTRNYMTAEEFDVSQSQEGWMHYADGSVQACRAIAKDDGKFIVLCNGGVQEGEPRRKGTRIVPNEWAPTGYPILK